MSQLRDFVYLDTVRLHSFVSQIHGGLISEISETIRRQGGLSAGLDIQIPALGGGNVGASKGKENQRQQTVQLTDPAYFGALYEHLRGTSEITALATGELKTREGVTEGEFVELVGIAEPPAVEHWITRVRSLVDFLDRNWRLLAQTQSAGHRKPSQQTTRKQMGLFKGMVDFLEDYVRISRKDPGKQYIRVAQKDSVYAVWCGLLPDHVVTPLDATLPAEIRVVGRVETLLGEGEVYKIVDLSQFGQSDDVNKLLTALNAFGPLIGQQEISATDLQAQYPDVFVTPIAVFR